MSRRVMVNPRVRFAPITKRKTNELGERWLFHCERQESVFHNMKAKKARKLSFHNIPAEMRNIVHA